MDSHNVRTAFLLKNIFSYMLENKYKFHTICAKNWIEKDTFKNFKEILDRFKDEYGYIVRNQCFQLDPINEDTVDSILSEVGNELFSDGITWNQIIAFFCFVGELTLVVISKKLPNSLVDVIFEYFSKFVNENLELWIQDHDGWEGIFMKKEDIGKISSKYFLFKMLMYTIVIIFGTLSDVGNILNGNKMFR